jgi:hypothetical protein
MAGSCAAVAVALLAGCGEPQKPDEDVAAAPGINSPPLPQRSPLPGPRVVLVQKSARTLGLYLNGELADTYRVGLGHRPEGHKEREGDSRTPEGVYYICTRNANSRFHLFLGISYPNAEDAKAARAGGTITEADHRAVTQAIASGGRPPWNTPLGGEVGIHGGGAASDWTLGCIALDNAAIEELWRVLKTGDPVVIRP